MAIYFEWDAAKAHSNARKHGVSFGLAKLVFDDPFAWCEQDRTEGGELRWRTIGQVGDVVVLLVAHTHVDHEDGDESIRIISARKATAHESRRYEQEKYR